MERFHINKHGLAAVCSAKGKCPLGNNDEHFKTYNEAQNYVDKRNQKEFGLIYKRRTTTTKTEEINTNSKRIVKQEKTVVDETFNNKTSVKDLYKKAVTKADKKYIRERVNYLRKEREGNTYMDRCKSSTRLKNYRPKNSKTDHFKLDRADKSRALRKHFGKGQSVGFYEVNHIVGSRNAKNRYRKQVVEVKDTGQIVVYDKHTGAIVTTFIASRPRIEAVMTLADEMPSQSFMNQIEANSTFAKTLSRCH